jgi:hypothetical protein
MFDVVTVRPMHLLSFDVDQAAEPDGQTGLIQIKAPISGRGQNEG